jgi:hypothetical protein
MNEHRCAVCGHINSAQAKLCDMCESSLGGPDAVDDSGEQSYAYDAGAYAPEPHVHTTPFKVMNDVVGPTLELYRKNFLLVIILVVVATMPEVLLQYGFVQVLASSPGDAHAAAVLVSLLLRVVSLVSGAMLSGSLAYAVFDLRLAGSASARESLVRGLKALPKVFLIYLLWSLVVGIGYMLCIVPGIILSLKYALVVPVAVAENCGPVESFDRSSKLTKGHKGLIFLTYFLWMIAISVVGLVVGGSFFYGGGDSTFVVELALALVIGMLNSSTAVLTVFIYLGLLPDRSQGFDARTFTPSSDPAER